MERRKKRLRDRQTHDKSTPAALPEPRTDLPPAGAEAPQRGRLQDSGTYRTAAPPLQHRRTGGSAPAGAQREPPPPVQRAPASGRGCIQVLGSPYQAGGFAYWASSPLLSPSPSLLENSMEKENTNPQTPANSWSILLLPKASATSY